jgi:hypothetical protein
MAVIRRTVHNFYVTNDVLSCQKLLPVIKEKNILSIVCRFSEKLNFVSLRIPSRTIRDISPSSVHRDFKASPSARCVSATTQSVDIFNEDRILLTHISWGFTFCYFLKMY